MTEFGDFSHHRPVLLPDGAIRQIPRRTTHPAADLTALGRATADQYFDLGYPGIAWKISEGIGYEDPTWRGAYATAVRRRRWFLGYHFDRAAFDGGAQFDWFLSRLLAGAGGRLRPAGMDRLCLDSEDTQTPLMAQQSAIGFTRRAVAAGYAEGCVYSAPWFDSYTRPATVRLDLLPVGWQVGWVSDYTAGQPDGAVELPAGWARGRVWARQYTDAKPGLPGLPMGCDFNRILRPWPAGGQEDALPTVDEVWAAKFGWPPEITDVPHAKDTYSARDWLIGASVNSARAVREAGDAQAAVAGLAKVVAQIGAQVGALTDDEAHILAATGTATTKVLVALQALLAADGAAEARLIAAIEAVPAGPGGGVDAAAVVAALRDTLIAGTA